MQVQCKWQIQKTKKQTFYKITQTPSIKARQHRQVSWPAYFELQHRLPKFWQILAQQFIWFIWLKFPFSGTVDCMTSSWTWSSVSPDLEGCSDFDHWTFSMLKDKKGEINLSNINMVYFNKIVWINKYIHTSKMLIRSNKI